ncbi:MAG: undecaprenyl-diphosphatase UppP [Actinomycetota bacterium]
MSILQGFVLGLVQGLTEFLPVSSSGHLQLVPFMFGWHEPTIAFDVAVHLGTLIAVVYFFRDEVRGWVQTVLHWREAPGPDRKLVTLVAIGTIPAVVIGGIFDSSVERVFQRPVVVSLLLGVTGYLLLSAETRFEHATVRARDDKDLTGTDAAIVGGWQAVSILPGISRSGATISGAMRLGIERGAAARFSFLLSIPVIFGAIVFKLPDMAHQGLSGSGPAMVVGVVVSAFSGFFAVSWFLGIIDRRGLRPFGIYCFFAMVAGLLTGLARG